MAQFKVVVNVTDKHGNPLIGLDVELVDTNAFTPAVHDPIEHIVAVEATDISGTATFTGLAPAMYYARPRITRPDIRIQMMMPSGQGGGGKMCYAALVQPDGLGTHTTIQAAITALGTSGGFVFICAGTYQENLVVAGDTDDLWLVGAGRGEVLIQGTAASPTITVDAVGTGGVTRFRLEHLTIDHTSGQTLLYFNSVAGGIPTQIDLLDLRFVSGTVGIDFSDINGGSRFTLRDIIMESTVVDAGQLEVADLVITNLRIYCTGDGLYVSGVSAANVIRISDSHLQAGGDFALRIGVGNDVQVSNTRINALGAKGILIGNTVDVILDNVIVDMTDGVAIDVGGIGTAITISDCKLSCASSQSPAKAGITVSGLNNDIHIVDTRISGFESFGIELETLVAGGGQHFVLDGNIIINGADTHSISIGGWDYGTIVGNVLVGTGGGNTTYGIYGAANTTYVVIVGNISEAHDGLTNLTTGVDGNIIGGNTGDGGGMGPNPHEPVTLDANAETLLSLSTQELGLDTQLANLVFAGAVSGGAAVPAFRSLVEADIPAAIMRDQEHTDIGNAAPHHAAVTLAGGSAAELSLAGQVLTLAAVLTPTEHTNIGTGAPHHASVTLGGGSDAILALVGQELTLGDVATQAELNAHAGAGGAHHAAVTLAGGSAAELTLNGQELTLAAVLTPTEHTAIGDSAPHHAAEGGESGTHTHGNLYYTEAEHGGVSPQGHHALVTLAADAQELLNLSTQELGFVAKAANLVLAGPAAGGAADPTFRSLVAADIPDISATYLTPAAHTAIGDGAPHHARLHAITDVLDHSATNWRMFYSDGSAHIIELALGADGTFLQSGGAGTLPEFTALVAGDIPDISATYIAKAFMAAKGDLITATAGNTPAILSVGADTHVLTADSGEATGLKWAAGGAGGVQTLIEDADQDTKIQCEEGADEDKIRFDTAGSERMQIDENGRVAIGATPILDVYLYVRPTETIAVGSRTAFGATLLEITFTGANQTLHGIQGLALGRGSGTGQIIYGLNFAAGAYTVSGNLAIATAANLHHYWLATTCNITDARLLHLAAPIQTSTQPNITTLCGIDMEDITGADALTGLADVYGIRVADFSQGTNRYFLELGDTPFLRLLANAMWTPAAGETPLYLAYGGTPTLGQVKYGAAGGGGTKEVFLYPRVYPVSVVGNWYLRIAGAGVGTGFVWKVPADFASLNSVNIVMIPDATETVQADLYVSVSAVGEDYNNDDRTLANQQLAVTINDITEWNIKLGTIFDNIAADDYVAIRFSSDTGSLRIVGCRISYEAGGNGGSTFLYLA